MKKPKIIEIRRWINNSGFGRSVNDTVLGVIVEALSLKLNALVRGKDYIELSNDQLYYPYSYCFGKGVSERPSNISLGVRDSLRNFYYKRFGEYIRPENILR
ncbi:hypothetical protein FJZ19_02875 [Candidatus Pacearchaeota archaeon]|nr:hypothetical protein [Candidatus Pacearchaeota archaeon]